METTELTYAQHAILKRIKDKIRDIPIDSGSPNLACNHYNECHYNDSYEDSNGSYYSDAEYKNYR